MDICLTSHKTKMGPFQVHHHRHILNQPELLCDFLCLLGQLVLLYLQLFAGEAYLHPGSSLMESQIYRKKIIVQRSALIDPAAVPVYHLRKILKLWVLVGKRLFFFRPCLADPFPHPEQVLLIHLLPPGILLVPLLPVGEKLLYRKYSGDQGHPCTHKHIGTPVHQDPHGNGQRQHAQRRYDYLHQAAFCHLFFLGRSLNDDLLILNMVIDPGGTFIMWEIRKIFPLWAHRQEGGLITAFCPFHLQSLLKQVDPDWNCSFLCV